MFGRKEKGGLDAERKFFSLNPNNTTKLQNFNIQIFFIILEMFVETS